MSTRMISQDPEIGVRRTRQQVDKQKINISEIRIKNPAISLHINSVQFAAGARA